MNSLKLKRNSDIRKDFRNMTSLEGEGRSRAYALKSLSGRYYLQESYIEKIVAEKNG